MIYIIVFAAGAFFGIALAAILEVMQMSEHQEEVQKLIDYIKKLEGRED